MAPKTYRSSNRVRHSRIAETPGEVIVPASLQPQDKLMRMHELDKLRQDLHQHVDGASHQSYLKVPVPTHTYISLVVFTHRAGKECSY